MTRGLLIVAALFAVACGDPGWVERDVDVVCYSGGVEIYRNSGVHSERMSQTTHRFSKHGQTDIVSGNCVLTRDRK